jgi:hypothetical protein
MSVAAPCPSKIPPAAIVEVGTTVESLSTRAVRSELVR